MSFYRKKSAITMAKINYDIYNKESLGIIKSIKINKDKTIFDYGANDKVKDRIKEIKELLKKESDIYEKDFYSMRIAMLKNKMAEIVVGGTTKTERKERIMRFEDSLCAISSSYQGIVVGSGLVYYKISNWYIKFR